MELGDTLILIQTMTGLVGVLAILWDWPRCSRLASGGIGRLTS